MSHPIPQHPTRWTAMTTAERESAVSAVAARAAYARRQPARAPAKMRQPPPIPTLNYARLAAMIYKDRRMSATAIRLVAQLIEWARGRGTCTAYVDQLAEILGVSGRTIQRAEIRAQECGYIKIQYIRHGSQNSANRYELTPLATGGPAASERTGERRTAPSRSIAQETDLSPHEVGLTPTPPYSPPRGVKMSSPQARRLTCGLKPAARSAQPPPAPPQSLNPLGGGAGANGVPTPEDVPPDRPRRRRSLPRQKQGFIKGG